MTRPAYMERNEGPRGRAARAGTCRSCGAKVLRGLDADVCAMTATVDPDPISPQGEALARLADRRTYDLRPSGNRWELNVRDRWHIRGRPAGQPAGLRFDVLAEHRCGSAALPGTATMFPPAEKGSPDADPPF